MNENQQLNLQRIQRGQEAMALDAVFRTLVQGRVNAIVNASIAAYRAGASDRTFFAMAAEISALTGLLQSLESAELQGNIAMEKEVRNGQGPT